MVQLTNETPFETMWTSAFAITKHDVAVAVSKATYMFSDRNDAPLISAPKGVELQMADEFGPDPATDAPVRENDFAMFKPACDVLVIGDAHAPAGRPASRVKVGMKLGNWFKSFIAIGPRVWESGLRGTRASDPRPFTTQSISYDSAYGGTVVDPNDPGKIFTFLPNPVGIGYYPERLYLDGFPLPLSEEPNRSVTDSSGNYRPMALGPIGRNWDPRFRYGGTYDKAWQDDRAPFFPEDFDERYFQAAPPDQQIPYPLGGEIIDLLNLTPEGRFRTWLPREQVFVLFLKHRTPSVEMPAMLDTILIEPSERRVCLTWRASLKLERDPFELREIVFELGSTRSRAKSRARLGNKEYYSSLRELPSGARGRP